MRFPEQLILNGAPSQFDRGLRLLEAAQPRVDGRSFPELLDFAVRFAKLVRFYDLRNEVDGDWQPFFLTDPTMVLATMAAPGLEEIEEEYRRRERRTRAERRPHRKFEALRSTATVILDLACEVNRWLEVLSGSLDNGAAQYIGRELVAMIESSLRSALQTLKSYDEGAAECDALDRPLGLDFEGFLPLWELHCVVPDGSIYRGCNHNRRIDHALPFFAPLFHAFVDAIADLQASVLAQFEASLTQGDHKAQVALYMAFARLFETAQASVNTISERYQRFYYRDVLRGRPRPALADSLFLTFVLAEEEGVAQAAVPRDTLFPAGEDSEGLEILFAADKGLTVTAAALESILTLRTHYGPLYRLLPPTDSEEASPEPSIVERGILSSEITPLPALETPTAPWSTFGETSLVETTEQRTQPATLGFALASTYLWLTGGVRTIDITVVVDPTYVETVLRPRLQELRKVTRLPELEIFHQVLTEAFDLYLSTTEGWLAIESYSLVPTAETVPMPDPMALFTLRIVLPPSVPPIVALGAEVEDVVVDSEEAEGVEVFEISEDARVIATNPSPELPTLKGYLWHREIVIEPAAGGRSVELRPLSLLADMPVTDFEIEIDVQGLAGLNLTNTDGEVDPSVPFPLFGGLPAVGSFLEIGQPELFAKNLEWLRIQLRWLQLPQNETGFLGYYRDYTLGLDGEEPEDPPLFDNRTFRGLFRLSNPGSWKFAGDPGQIDVYLFRSYASEAKNRLHTAEEECRKAEPQPGDHLCWVTAFENLKIDPHPATLPPYYDPGDGRIRLELIDPAYAFGNDLYALNVLNSVIEDLPNADGCLLKCQLHCADQSCETYGECIAKCMTECMQPGSELKYPNEPYLPQAEWLSLDYKARCSLPGTSEETAPCVEFHHLLPFDGTQRCQNDSPLLPVPEPENLFLGFSNLPPREDLTLFFEMIAEAQGRHDDSPDLPPPPVVWQVLSENRWFSLKAEEIPFDSTHGLQNTGIVTLDLPLFNDHGSTVLPAQLQWLRAGIEHDPRIPAEPPREYERPSRRADSFPKTQTILPHALPASWRKGEDDGVHLEQPIPAGTIVSSVEELAQIASIAQPLPSFGGRPAENEERLAVRLGERLRHKERALLGWDYERLVLERFPEIWKVSALPTRTPRRGDRPGHVLLVVVPRGRDSEVLNPIQPQAPAHLLRRIEEFLRERTSPWVELRVVNPVYVAIDVKAKVEWVAGEVAGAATDRLDRELVDYLSPGFYDAQRAATQGRYVSESQISEFIQTRPYVAALHGLETASDRRGLEWIFLTSTRHHSIETVPTRYLAERPGILSPR